MSYDTCSFKKVFEDVVRATGRPLSVIDALTVDEQERYAGLVNEALETFWNHPGPGYWPGTFAIEQRTIDADDSYILKQADGETEIGNIDPEECFFEELPKPGSLYGVLGLVEDRGDRIVCFDDDCPAQPYIRFQLPRPGFTRAAYDAEESYAERDLVYDADTGECYRSLLAGNAGHAIAESDWWELQAFPAMAKIFVKWSASAEHMAEDDGKYKQAARAMRELERLEETLLPRRPVRR